MFQTGMATKRLILVLALLPIAAGAQVYRWTDEEGRTIVSDTPPPGKSKGQKITKGDASRAGAAKTPGADGKAAANGSDADPAAKKSAQSGNAEELTLCKQAQQNLQLLESNAPLTLTTPEGQRVVADESARAREMARLRGILQNCR